MVVPHLVRVLNLTTNGYMTGKDVEAVRRGGIRYLHDDKRWKAYTQMAVASRRTFGPGMKALVKDVQKAAGLVADGKAGPAVDRVLRKSGAYDARCDALLEQYADGILPKWCYPHPQGAVSSVCQGLHVTAGLDRNWAIDFCAPGGTIVVAVVEAEVVKISGRDPSQGADQNVGIFGWNIHYWTPDGYRWFSTHYGSYSVRVGQKLRVGQPVGIVGYWPGNPGRSHTHLGVTSPYGQTDAKRWITRVSAGRRMKVPAV